MGGVLREARRTKSAKSAAATSDSAATLYNLRACESAPVSAGGVQNELRSFCASGLAAYGVRFTRFGHVNFSGL